MSKSNQNVPFNTGDTVLVKIADLNHDGEGVGKAEGFTLFIPGALPGEEVRAKVDVLKKGYGRAGLLTIIKPSLSRTEPFCPIFSHCGGCQLQHLDYREQLVWKRERVAAALKRIGGLTRPVNPVIGMESPLAFRNKADLHTDIDNGKVTLGFYALHSRRIVDVYDCPVQHPLNNKFLRLVRSLLQSDAAKYRRSIEGGIPLSGITLRSSFSTNQCMVAFKTGKDRSAYQLCKKYAGLLAEKAKKELAGVVLLQDFKGKTKATLLYGQPYLEEKVGPFRYRISPLSFFQVNPCQAGRLYEEAASHLQDTGRAFDLYCGTGNLSLYLSRSAQRVTGIESAKAAVQDARANAELNKIENIDFVHARVEKVPHLLREANPPFTVFMNPPRGGSSPTLLNLLNQCKPEKIVYISCDPATLARDLKLITENSYLLTSIQPVDMFPHTSHVETVVLMSRVEGK